MKQSWARLFATRKIKREAYSTEAAYLSAVNAWFLRLFYKHHKHACEMLFSKDGECLAAIYYTPAAKDRQETKAIFKAVRERTLYGFEMGE